MRPATSPVRRRPVELTRDLAIDELEPAIDGFATTIDRIESRVYLIVSCRTVSRSS